MSDYIKFCRGADVLIHDSQYTFSEYEKYEGWGHSTFRDAVNLAIDAGVGRLGFFHHDPDRTDDELNRIVAGCRKTLSERKLPLGCFCTAEGEQLAL
jgi:ribonuclease BN (tRNA processing enzyme)